MRGGLHTAGILGAALVAISLSGVSAVAQTATPDTGPTGIDIIPTDLPAHASSVQQGNGPVSLLPGTIPTETRIEEQTEIPSLADQYQRVITGQTPLRPVHRQAPKTVATPVRAPSVQAAPIPAPNRPVAAVQSTPPSTPVETAAPTPASAPAGNGHFLIQLGAFRDTFTAETYWASFSIRYPELSKSHEKQIVSADLGSQGIYHRLQLVGFDNSESAQKQCRQLKADGTDCFATGH
ncbi:hypothetical protein UF64_12095 [Thalassospira sp. HJ]|nr:hypothetical protein UF64_12095 [Thalassospira sp. HJ]